MRLVTCVLALVLWSCGGQQTSGQPATGPMKLSELAPVMSPLAGSSPKKEYVILATKALPADDMLENLLAKKSTLAEVGPHPDGKEISIDGVVCLIKKTARPSTVPKHIMPEHTGPHGLSSEEAERLGSTSLFYAVSCTPDPELAVRGLPKYAEVVVGALADLSSGWIHDSQTGRYWPKAIWAASRKANERYESTRVVRILKIRTQSGQTGLVTRGMIAFGRPDLSLYPVADEQIDELSSTLRSIGDLLIDERQVGPGLRLPLGPIEVLLVDQGRYLATLGGSASTTVARSAGQTIAELSVVDPEGGQGVQSDHARFLRRLLIR